MSIFDIFKPKSLDPAKQKALDEKKRLEEERKRLTEARRVFEEGMISLKDIVAPSAFRITPNYLIINESYVQTLFVFTYPRFLNTNWLSPIISYDATMDISMFIYPQESKAVLEDLRNRVGRMQATYAIGREKGEVSDPKLETAIQDAEELRYRIQQGSEKLFLYGLYFTVYADSEKELKTNIDHLETVLGGSLIYTKNAILQQEQGFNSTLPLNNDELNITRNLDTDAISTSFPFTSVDLTSDNGIFYGFNGHNQSLVIFDRFDLANPNCTIFATSGAGKSYTVKLECLRYLMLGTDIIIIDPENEYQNLCEAVGGTYIPISINSDRKINPLDLPATSEGDEENALRTAIITISGIMNIMLGQLTPEESAIMDKAIKETYALKDITEEPSSHKNPAPLLSDLYSILINMHGGESMAQRLQKYTEGSYSGLLNNPTNIDLKSNFIVFSVRDLEEALRPIAMYVITNFIWTKIRTNLKRRIMVIDEAWNLMQYEDSARFLHNLTKRSRKYYLGVTTISQDVEDFLGSKWGKAMISNSAMQILLKQSPASIDLIGRTFNLTDGEKMALLESNVGEGIFFAGLNHVLIKIVASYTEHRLITSNPEEILSMRGGM
ncbi:MAG: VirB4-like conjugal transfer ATPase, CD1110 family [Patescibacteria group bacterium]